MKLFIENQRVVLNKSIYCASDTYEITW